MHPSSSSELFFPKELSWLSFNERVLQEANDDSNPIIERVRFLGIYSSNLDEFYRVRIANIRRRILLEQENEELIEETNAELLLQEVTEKISVLTKEFDTVYKKVFRELKKNHIHLVEPEHLTLDQVEWVRQYFNNEVLMHIAPILIEKKVTLTDRLNDSAAYFFISLDRETKSNKYAALEIPTDKTKRFINLPSRGIEKQVIMLDDVIAMSLDMVFKGFVKYDSIAAYSFKMTRDSEYSLDEGIDDSYLEKMSDSMKQRLSAEPVRVIYDQAMPDDMVKALKKCLKHTNYSNLVAAGKTRNARDFLKFPNVGRKSLENKALPNLFSHQFSKFDTVFDAISAEDILLHYPYHSFLHFTEFVRQAAFDPHVKHIRISLYRIASDSRIVSSLIDAVDNGKQVTVVVELRARFDEQANIAWAKTMVDAGVKVIFGNPAFKIHTKLCVVSREEKGEVEHYAHIGTGNFNENTAKIYTDFSLFTKEQSIARECISVFEMIQLPYRQQRFNQLMVSPVNAKPKLLQLIEQETLNAQQGKKAEILFKVNNLVDHDIVTKLYQASQQGVKVRGIVRGMCSLMPGIKGVSDNVYIISVVDRFLEHPRTMVFHNQGDPKVYISSADWMKRNMEDRIEVATPILSEKLRERIIHILELQFKDTMKARVIDKDQTNRYVKRGNRKKLRSQQEIFNYIKGLEKLESESDS